MIEVAEKRDPLDFDYREVVNILQDAYPDWDVAEIIKTVVAMLDEQRRLLRLALN